MTLNATRATSVLLLALGACANIPTHVDGMQEPVHELAYHTYASLAETAAADGVDIDLSARVSSEFLDMATHHPRLRELAEADPAGHWFYNRAPNTTSSLNFIDAPFIEFRDYQPNAPGTAFAVLDIEGRIDGRTVAYSAFVLRYDWPDGSCELNLVDPVMPSASSFVLSEHSHAIFPDCMSPVESMEKILRAADPKLGPLAYDPARDVFEPLAGGVEIALMSGIVANPGPDAPQTPQDSCPDLDITESPESSTTQICSDMWFGYGNWARGGGYEQKVTCVEQGEGCQVMQVGSSDDLWSRIEPKGWGSCQCCDNYGASVSGNTASATLISAADGTTGGHVAIAKSRYAFRTSTSTSRSQLKLEGQCGGNLDLPAHGANGNGSAGVDYTSANETVQNQAEVGRWNAESITSHLCYPDETPTPTPSPSPSPSPVETPAY